MSSILAIRESLRAQLAEAAEPALAMLDGTAPLDHVVLLGALEAAGLLDDVTVGSETLRDMRRTLVRAVVEPHGRDVLATLVADLDLSPSTVDLDAAEDEDETEQRLHLLIQAAGVAEVGGRPAGPLRRAVERNIAAVEAEPERYVDLAPVGARMSDALDLGDEHLAAELVRTVAETPALAATTFGRQALDAAHDRVRRDLFPAPLLAWAQHRPRRAEVMSFVERASATAPRLAAADDAGAELPFLSLALDEVRGEEVVLLGNQELALIGWAGPLPAPARALALPSGDPLPVDEDRGTDVTWRLDPLDPSTDAIRFEWEDGRTWDVQLDAP